MKCPHCLTSYHDELIETNIGNGGRNEGYWSIKHEVCPTCDKSIIFLSEKNQFQTKNKLIYPKKISRNPLPQEVTDISLTNDYNESCLVLDESPKASAALSRRCLQHILREKGSVKNGTLDSEIQQILDKNALPSDIADNLDAVRVIGNFAAHPMKSTNTGEVVDVEPEEAEWNLEVVEQLIDYYYVRPAISKMKKDALNAKLSETGKQPLK